MSMLESIRTSTGGPLLENSKPSLIHIGYPLRLSQKEIRIDDKKDTLNAREFWALQNIITFIRTNWRRYALELFVDFYTEHHDLINRFRSKRTGKICAMTFSEHGKMIFKSFQKSVENGLENWNRTMNRAKEITKTHVAHEVTLSDIHLLSDALEALILKKCDGLVSPTAQNALKKLHKELCNQQLAREIIEKDDVLVEIDE